MLHVICPSAGCSLKTYNTGAQNKSARLCAIWETFQPALECFPQVYHLRLHKFVIHTLFFFMRKAAPTVQYVPLKYYMIFQNPSKQYLIKGKVVCLFSPLMLRIRPVQDISRLLNSSHYSWLDKREWAGFQMHDLISINVWNSVPIMIKI